MPDSFEVLRQVIATRLDELDQRLEHTRAGNERRSIEIRRVEIQMLWRRFLMAGLPDRRYRQ